MANAIKNSKDILEAIVDAKDLLKVSKFERL